MANSIVQQDITGLLDGWIEAERNGVEFPVPFEAAWRIAEYSNKANAKQSGLKSLKKGKQFSCEIMKTPGGGRSSELINLSVDGFKHFCLMADTKVGEEIRQYFIEAEKKWKLVQEVAPQVAEEIEVLKLKRDIAKQEAIAAVAQEKVLALRDWATRQPKAICDRILGVTEVQGEVKTRTVVVDQMGNVVNAGDTLTKTQIAYELGFVNIKGKAETKQVAALVDEAIRAGAIPVPWRDERTVIATGFDAELLPKLKAFYKASPVQRQKWMGE